VTDWAGTIPIYITNFNWLTSTRALAKYFDDVPGVEVIIVDNCSTYSPLVEWYETNCPCRVVRLTENVGEHAVWHRGAILPPPVHRAFFGSDYYVVTDPDLSLEGCPKDVLNVLRTGLDENPDILKVGLSLELDDLPSTSPFTNDVRAWEAQFWRRRRGSQFYEAAVDTTFAMYRIDSPFDRVRTNQGAALRTDRPYTARHLPWYMDPAELSEEQLYYVMRTRIGSWGSRFREERERTVTGRIPITPPTAWTLTPSELGEFPADWGVSVELLDVLTELLRVCRPQAILEAGGGASSVAFQKYRREYPSLEYVGIDESGPAAEQHRTRLQKLGIPTDNILHCAVDENGYNLGQLAIAKGFSFDLVLIDGPDASHLRGKGRVKDLLHGHCESTTIFVLDDTHRGRESTLADELAAVFGNERYLRFVVPDQRYRPRRSTVLLPRSREAAARSSETLAFWLDLTSYP